LNFSFLRGVLASGADHDAPRTVRLQCWALRKLSKPFQIETLYRFNRKFNPSWLPRYVVVEAIEDLPRVAFAALRLEGLVWLPHRRGPEEYGDEEEPKLGIGTPNIPALGAHVPSDPPRQAGHYEPSKKTDP
jgi:hypothetical protein